jgi:hypothetical protein
MGAASRGGAFCAGAKATERRRTSIAAAMSIVASFMVASQWFEFDPSVARLSARHSL